ncbi:helix-turn-helix domain-containing protein [Streptomyces sp. NPDC090445]|uniref:helix-turn-helix domain-containing protein n=1 Tax=Streptomyces sp. NPDC090445 TaxID=3365963 RepID=UPI0037FC5064
MPGGRLTHEDRQRIADGLAEGLGYTEIGRRLGRPASTVMREVTRNPGTAYAAAPHRAWHPPGGPRQAELLSGPAAEPGSPDGGSRSVSTIA